MNNTTKLQLRLNGFSANDAGIVCDAGSERFNHERTGILRIENSRDTKEARAVVDAVIAAIDEPRALLGRDRRGGVVMLFRVDQYFSNTSGEATTLRSGEKFVISLASEGATVEPDAFTWAKGRSPLEIARDALPPFINEFSKIAYDAAWAAGARPADDFAREVASDRYRADLATGKIKVRTQAQADEDQQARSDAELVAEFDGVDFHWNQGNAERLILEARHRHAERQRKLAAA